MLEEVDNSDNEPDDVQEDIYSDTVSFDTLTIITLTSSIRNPICHIFLFGTFRSGIMRISMQGCHFPPNLNLNNINAIDDFINSHTKHYLSHKIRD